MQHILELTLEELQDSLKNQKIPVYRARQIFSWVYKKGVSDFALMSDLPAYLRQYLKDNFYICGLKLKQVLQSHDGTAKLLFELRDKNLIEAVSIPAGGRVTGCVSTQAGCKFSCRFCASGLLGFRRNLTCGEMIEEVLCLRKRKTTHLVFMGIGEPLDNYDNVLKAIRIINSSYAFNIASRRITISTCGIIPGIKKLSQEGLQIELSISLHAGDDRVRAQIMPVNKKYPLKELICACQEYILQTNRQITFEYVLIKGLNSSLQNAQKLSKMLGKLRLAKVNLIPANPIKELNVEPPRRAEILLFRDALLKAGINTTLRKPRGQDIEAACGQLRLRYEKS